MENYTDYQKERRAEISNQLAEKNSQPALLIGSGTSIRYFDAPSWTSLLDQLRERCPRIERPLEYFRQTLPDMPAVAAEFAKEYLEWSWESRETFPDRTYLADTNPEYAIKWMASEIIKEATPSRINNETITNLDEARLLSDIKPVCVVTTNYDTFVEKLFPDFQVVIGQEIITDRNYAIGEILKIHGCVTQPQSIVLTTSDYETYESKQKFIMAQLLTLFRDHVILIIGYSASDENIRAILSDIDIAYGLPGSKLGHIFILEYSNSIPNDEYISREKLIPISAERTVTVNRIVANDFGWVYEAFAASNFAPKIPLPTLRTLLSRSHELVRSDKPLQVTEVNFEFLEQALNSPEDFAKVLGIASLSTPTEMTAVYKYSLSEVATKLHGSSKTWHYADNYNKIIIRDTGIDVKKSDNKYHAKIKVNKSYIRKYSDEFLSLLRKVKAAGECQPAWVELGS